MHAYVYIQLWGLQIAHARAHTVVTAAGAAVAPASPLLPGASGANGHKLSRIFCPIQLRAVKAAGTSSNAKFDVHDSRALGGWIGSENLEPKQD